MHPACAGRRIGVAVKAELRNCQQSIVDTPQWTTNAAAKKGGGRNDQQNADQVATSKGSDDSCPTFVDIACGDVDAQNGFKAARFVLSEYSLIARCPIHP